MEGPKDNVVNLEKYRLKRQEPTTVSLEEGEKDPVFILEQRIFEFDIETHTLATILAMLDLAKKNGVAVDKDELLKTLNNFRFNGAHSISMLEMKQDILKVFYELREKLQDKVPFETVLAGSAEIEKQVRAATKSYASGGEE